MRPVGLPIPLFLFVAFSVASCSGGGSGGNGLTGPTHIPIPAMVANVTLVGAGDIAYCPNLEPAKATAKQAEEAPGAIFTAGDNVQGSGSAEEFRDCFNPTWGRFKDRILFPAVGNHEYNTPGALPYFSYFAPTASGVSGEGYYSKTYGAWKIYVLNSNTDVGSHSPQFMWLKNDLESDASKCGLAIWHHPLFSSGPEENHLYMKEVWQLLNQHHVGVVINGHDHIYERFAPQDSDGRYNLKGIRQFTVGTGGMYLNEPSRQRAVPNSEIKIFSHGLIHLLLRSSSYDWEFRPVDPGIPRDFGSDVCR